MFIDELAMVTGGSSTATSCTAEYDVLDEKGNLLGSFGSMEDALNKIGELGASARLVVFP